MCVSILVLSTLLATKEVLLCEVGGKYSLNIFWILLSLDTKIVFYSTGEVGKSFDNRRMKLPTWPSKCNHWCRWAKFKCMWNCSQGPFLCEFCDCKQICGFENGFGKRWRQESKIQAETFAVENNFVFWNDPIAWINAKRTTTPSTSGSSSSGAKLL